MPHIQFKNSNPGIVQAMTDFPKTAQPLSELAQLLLQSDEGLSKSERELIAAQVSTLNGCFFCSNSHLNVSLAHAKLPHKTIEPGSEDITKNFAVRPVVRALLNIAAKVQKGGKFVTEKDVRDARDLGASDLMIHDTVLIAAAFCMYNRYVDGLATLTPKDPRAYEGMGKMLAQKGYMNVI